jgi:DNA polymerase I-like protein with 3'-5' exonuclease and polymerase domains
MEYPNLKNAKFIAIDTETYDPELIDNGPGWGRGVGHVVGISAAVEGHSWYFPMRHEGGGNLPIENVLTWAADNISDTPGVPKIFANAQYDIGWLKHEGIPVAGRVHDVQLAEPLLNEHSYSYSLDTIANKYLGKGKVQDDMYDKLRALYGGPKGRKQAGNIWRAHADLVAEYAKADASLLIEILPLQLALIKEQKLESVYDLECELVHLLIDMRMRGVRVDVDKAQRVYDDFNNQVEQMQREIGHIEIANASQIAAYCDKLGIAYGRTATGKPQFVGSWLREHVPQIADIRRLTKAKDTFVKGYILDKHINGRVHGQFNQLRSDDYGTVSGRLSASNPNLQNIPSRDEEIGPLVRSMFLPDEGEIICSQDWSQIEFRMFVHYANDQELIDAYSKDGTDFHNVVAELFGNLIPRKIIKNFNFMLLYGGGVNKLAVMLADNLTVTEATTLLDKLMNDMSEIETSAQDDLYLRLAKVLFAAYKIKFPAAKHLADLASRTANSRGFVKTLLGRRARFDKWVPSKWSSTPSEPLSHADALVAYGNSISRSGTHKTLNSILQGSAADVMKTAMVQMVRAGVTDVLGPPLLTVHDELVWSAPETKEALAALDHAKWIMCNCMPNLRVPLMVDDERGLNWGSVK